MIDIKSTLLSGQTFRWKRISEDLFDGVILNKRYILNSKLETEDPILLDYFDQDRDYESLRGIIREAHPNLKKAVELSGPLFILRQEPWQVIFSFITSQNNNIKRISNLIENISNLYGKKIDKERSAFPTITELKDVSEERFKDLSFGFRAKYLRSAIDYFLDHDIKNPSYDDLLKIKGIGDKVASCIYLYGYAHHEYFPIDVHIKRALNNDFLGLNVPALKQASGLAQQYIFEYQRRKER